MNNQQINIATRKSPLALWQAEFVKKQLQIIAPEVIVNLIPMTTQGDKILDTSLAKIGGKGLFIKELETAIFEKRADIAVHSAKDLPVQLPEGLCISTILSREDPRDAMVSNKFKNLQDLPAGARVGTSSLRRQCQLRALRDDLLISDLRGNVNTRLKKLDSGEYDAIILASAGLIRLGFTNRISQIINTDIFLPAVGQGILAIETRDDDDFIKKLLMPMHDAASAVCISAERSMNLHLNGGCQVPIGGLAQIADEILTLNGLVGAPSGSPIVKAKRSGKLDQAKQIGEQVAKDLLAQGADSILAKVYSHE